MEIIRFKKGQKIHLDEVYHMLGLIPEETYDQDDALGHDGGDNGESITFKKNVEIKTSVKVT